MLKLEDYVARVENTCGAASTGIDLEVFSDLFDRVTGADRALARGDFTRYQFFCERQAAWLPAGAAIGAGKQIVGCLDSRVFIDLQETLRDSEYRPEEQTDSNHDGRRYEQTVHSANRS